MHNSISHPQNNNFVSFCLSMLFFRAFESKCMLLAQNTFAKEMKCNTVKGTRWYSSIINYFLNGDAIYLQAKRVCDISKASGKWKNFFTYFRRFSFQLNI